MLRILTTYRIETSEPNATKFGRIYYGTSEKGPKPNLVQSVNRGKMVKYNVFSAFLCLRSLLNRRRYVFAFPVAFSSVQFSSVPSSVPSHQ